MCYGEFVHNIMFVTGVHDGLCVSFEFVPVRFYGSL